MRTIKGPALFIAQYVDADLRLSTLEGLCAFAAELGFKALQIPTFLPHIFDLARAAESRDYCDDVRAVLARHGLEIAEPLAPRLREPPARNRDELGLVGALTSRMVAYVGAGSFSPYPGPRRKAAA